MTEDTEQPTRDPYYNPRSLWTDEATPEPSPIAELVAAMHKREDGGRGFWSELAKALDDVPDRPLPRRPVTAAVDPAWLTGGRHDPVVYYLRFGDRVKIGTTTNLRVRLTAIPYDEVLAVELGGYDLEQARHREYSKLRVIGEWFRYEGGLVEWVEHLRRK